MNELCSSRLLLPFMRLVTVREDLRDLVPDLFWSADPNGRVSLDLAQAMLNRAVERLRDDDLGLKQGRGMRFGEGGPFDYAIRSAPTVREAVGVAARYSRLQTDSFRVWFESWRSYGLIRLFDEASWTRPAADFAMSAIYKVHLADTLLGASHIECWFPYLPPHDSVEHERSFPGAKLKFGAPFFGFAFDRSYESAPMPGADPVLHASHCARVDALLAGISGSTAIKTELRRLIEQELGKRSGPIVPRVARAMGVSPRTLSRKLKQEGGSFTEELDGARRDLALSYVGESDISLNEAAFLLGFAHVESFYRAFKRWTGTTPLAYRRQMTVGRSFRAL
jgi:AraC-like DNA-binding protein